jgi:tetratricopeptide (TPR) repeat protein
MEYFNQIKELSDKGNIREALELSDKWRRAEPTNPKAWYNFGTLLHFNKNNSSAEKALIKCIDLDAEHVHGLSNLGSVLCSLSRHKEAVRHFEKALDLSKEEDRGAIMARLADCYLNLGKYNLATPLIGKLYEVDEEIAQMLEGKMVRDIIPGKRKSWWKNIFK